MSSYTTKKVGTHLISVLRCTTKVLTRLWLQEDAIDDDIGQAGKLRNDFLRAIQCENSLTIHEKQWAKRNQGTTKAFSLSLLPN